MLPQQVMSCLLELGNALRNKLRLQLFANLLRIGFPMRTVPVSPCTFLRAALRAFVPPPICAHLILR